MTSGSKKSRKKPRTEHLTFDQAQEAFRDAPNSDSAANYVAVATMYYLDQMIGLDTFVAAVDEVKDAQPRRSQQ